MVFLNGVIEFNRPKVKLSDFQNAGLFQLELINLNMGNFFLVEGILFERSFSSDSFLAMNLIVELHYRVSGLPLLSGFES